MTRLFRLTSTIVASLALLGAAATAASADATSGYNTGYTLGHEAYEYGLPLLDTARVFKTMISINVADHSGDGPVNHFNNVPKLTIPTASQKTVVAPNEDTLYSIAWLDLSHGPQVIHVPAIKHRFYVIPLYTPYTENFYNITSDRTGPTGQGDYGATTGGDYAVVPPGFHGKLPRGVKRVHSPYKRVWIIGRTLIRGKSDTTAVDKIQAGLTIAPLSKYGTHYKPKPPTHPKRTLKFATVPGTQPHQNPLAFYTALGQELTRFAPPAADRPLLNQLKAIGVGPGLDPATNSHLSADTLRGMRDAVTKGPANLKTELTQLYVQSAQKHNGYLILGTGTYGTDYQLRALVDNVGLGALRTDVAIYPLAQTDMNFQALTGTKSYVLHIPAGGLPPVKGFWSLTMYDLDGFFVHNPLGRYVINDRSNLHHNPDGSIDLYVQHTQPSDAAEAQNWLPAPTGSFRLIWRLYDTGSAEHGILNGNGWQPPKVQPCATGAGPLGTACAS